MAPPLSIAAGPSPFHEVMINTQATDAKGIARDIHAELAAQANNGLN